MTSIHSHYKANIQLLSTVKGDHEQYHGKRAVGNKDKSQVVYWSPFDTWLFICLLTDVLTTVGGKRERARACLRFILGR